MNSWHILPAAQCLYGKSKVSLDEIMAEEGKGTIVICRKPNDQLHFISGCSGNYAKVGERVETKHDQTLARIGTWVVVNEIHYDLSANKIDWLSQDDKMLTSTKAAMAVFK
jgi:hypothetical protein